MTSSDYNTKLHDAIVDGLAAEGFLEERDDGLLVVVGTASDVAGALLPLAQQYADQQLEEAAREVEEWWGTQAAHAVRACKGGTS